MCASIGPGNAVTDRVHVRHAGAHLVVDEDLAAPAEVETDRGGIEPAERRLASDGDERVVALERLLRAVLLDVDENAIAVASPADDAGAGAEIEALSSKDAVALFHDVVVHAGKNRRHELDDGDLGAESSPDGAELEADDAAADDDEVAWDARDGERADVREDALFVEFEEWELDWYGAGGNDDVLRGVRWRYCLSGGAPSRTRRDRDFESLLCPCAAIPFPSPT